jgi:hypothetical protein
MPHNAGGIHPLADEVSSLSVAEVRASPQGPPRLPGGCRRRAGGLGLQAGPGPGLVARAAVCTAGVAGCQLEAASGAGLAPAKPRAKGRPAIIMMAAAGAAAEAGRGAATLPVTVAARLAAAPRASCCRTGPRAPPPPMRSSLEFAGGNMLKSNSRGHTSNEGSPAEHCASDSGP